MLPGTRACPSSSFSRQRSLLPISPSRPSSLPSWVCLFICKTQPVIPIPGYCGEGEEWVRGLVLRTRQSRLDRSCDGWDGNANREVFWNPVLPRMWANLFPLVLQPLASCHPGWCHPLVCQVVSLMCRRPAFLKATQFCLPEGKEDVT